MLRPVFATSCYWSSSVNTRLGSIIASCVLIFLFTTVITERTFYAPVVPEKAGRSDISACLQPGRMPQWGLISMSSASFCISRRTREISCLQLQFYAVLRKKLGYEYIHGPRPALWHITQPLSIWQPPDSAWQILIKERGRGAEDGGNTTCEVARLD